MRRNNIWSGLQVALMLAFIIGMVVQVEGRMPYSCGPCYELFPEWFCWLNGCP